MRRIGLIVLALLAVSHPAWAATYDITTNAEQDAALTAIVEQVNIERAAQTPPKPALTVEQYLKRRVKDVVESYVEVQKRADDEHVKRLYRDADEPTRTKMKNVGTCGKADCK